MLDSSWKTRRLELFGLLYCIWVENIKAVITLLVCDSVTRIICAPALCTDHFRLRCQKDQRASPWIRLMYKAEMRSVCCQRQLRAGTPLRLVCVRDALPVCRLQGSVCDPLAIRTDQLSSVLQLTFSGNTKSTCRRLLLL